MQEILWVTDALASLVWDLIVIGVGVLILQAFWVVFKSHLKD